MTKILFVASECAPGMVPFASTIINSLSSLDEYSVYAVLANNAKQVYKNTIDKKVNATFIDSPACKFEKLVSKFYPFRLVEAIKQVAEQNNIKKIHLLTGDFSLYQFVKRNLDSYEFYYTVHDLHQHESNTMSFWGRLLHKYVIYANKGLRDKISNLTTSSQAQYEELKQIYSYKNIEFTHFPSLVTPAIKNGQKKVKELEGKSDYILFFGAVDEYKGVDILADSFCKLSLPNKHLIIAGRGHTKLPKNKQIIRINRFIDDEEVKDLFSKARLIVYPYRSATMSGVLSIAFYFQKEVLATNIPFFKQYENPGVHFFSHEINNDLLNQLLEVLNSQREICNFYDIFYNNVDLIKDYKRFYNAKQNSLDRCS